jgi:hypothetical protein
MASAEPISVVRLIQQARLYVLGALPTGIHQSYPVPVRDPKGIRLAFFYGHAEILKPGEGFQLWPPTYVALLHPETAKLQELRAIAPKDFGQRHAQDQPLGAYLTMPERMQAEFLTKQVRWYQAYDVLLPLFAARSPRVPPEGKQALAEFNELFPQVTEAPLLPYYQTVGKEFFAWLKAVNG